jgi:hypothetical protein
MVYKKANDAKLKQDWSRPVLSTVQLGYVLLKKFLK